MIRLFASDIYAVKRIGLDKWQNNLSLPISDAEYSCDEMFIWGLFDGLHASLDAPDRALILSDSHFVVFLINYIHAEAVKAFCISNKVELCLGPLANKYYVPKWAELSHQFDNQLQCGYRQGIVRKSRRFFKNIVFNGGMSRIDIISTYMKPTAVGLGSASRWKIEYANKNKIKIDHADLAGLLCGGNLVKFTLSPSLRTSIDQFIEKMALYCRVKYSISLDQKQICNCWHERLKKLGGVYQQVIDKKKLPAQVLITGASLPLHRIVGHAFEARGKQNIVFHHGNGMGGIAIPRVAYVDGSSGSTYVCPTLQCAKAYQRNYLESGISKHRRTSFQSLNTGYYESLYRQSMKVSYPSKIRSVMIMGYPMNVNRGTVSGQFFASHLDLEIRLIKSIKAAGYKVYYKIHPDRKMEALDIFEPICDRVLSDPFEDVWKETDALLFKYTTSTTFGHALCTNRPIIWIDKEKDYWDPEQHDLLSRRCIVIPASVSEDGRIHYQEDTLFDALSKKPAIPDFSYVRKYMFPQDGSA